MRPCSRKTCRNTLRNSWLDSCDPGTRTATTGRFAAPCALTPRGRATTTIPASRLMNFRRRIRPPVRSAIGDNSVGRDIVADSSRAVRRHSECGRKPCWLEGGDEGLRDSIVDLFATDVEAKDPTTLDENLAGAVIGWS